MVNEEDPENLIFGKDIYTVFKYGSRRLADDSEPDYVPLGCLVLPRVEPLSAPDEDTNMSIWMDAMDVVQFTGPAGISRVPRTFFPAYDVEDADDEVEGNEDVEDDGEGGGGERMLSPRAPRIVSPSARRVSHLVA